LLDRPNVIRDALCHCRGFRLEASAFSCALLVLKHWQGFCFNIHALNMLALASIVKGKQAKKKIFFLMP
jgi:hypothetical protein